MCFGEKNVLELRRACLDRQTDTWRLVDGIGKRRFHFVRWSNQWCPHPRRKEYEAMLDVLFRMCLCVTLALMEL